MIPFNMDEEEMALCQEVKKNYEKQERKIFKQRRRENKKYWNEVSK